MELFRSSETSVNVDSTPLSTSNQTVMNIRIDQLSNR
jgi:hypothetical protein